MVFSTYAVIHRPKAHLMGHLCQHLHRLSLYLDPVLLR